MEKTKRMSAWKKGTRLVALLSAVALTAGVFAGCGAKTETKDEQGRTIVTIGNWPDEQTNEKNFKLKEEQRLRFEEANPDYVIRTDKWIFDLQSFYAKAEGGQLPTIFDTNFTEIPQLIDGGYTADITDVLKEEGIYDLMNKQVLECVSRDGKVYSFPTSAYCLGMGINMDHFKKAGLVNPDGTPMQPKNWDEVVEFAVKLKAATGEAGFLFPTANNSGGWIFTCLAWSFGTEFMKQDSDGKWTATFNSPEAAAALQWIKDLKWKYDVLPVNTFIDGPEQMKTMGSGKASMMITAGDLPNQLAAYDIEPDSIGMIALPAGPKRHVTLMGGYTWSVRKDATKDQIRGAIKWMNTSDSPILTDEVKLNMEDKFKQDIEKGRLVTIKSMSPWSADSEVEKFRDELIAKYSNGTPEHVKLYNDFVQNLGDCELQAEEPICTQELYGILDGCIQEVLTNKDADPAALLEKANSDFQMNYLDNL